MAAKIVAIGSVDGNFESVFKKLGKVQAKTPFTSAFIVGDLFADPAIAGTSAEHQAAIDSLISGSVEIPLPTYFTAGRHPFPPRIIERLQENDDEICPNLQFIGRASHMKSVEGVRTVALGGVLNPAVVGSSIDGDKYQSLHTETEARRLHGLNTADILISTNWPSGVRSGSKAASAEGVEEPPSEQCIADLCTHLKPRYHFASSPDLFFEREPFYFPPSAAADARAEAPRPVTRFISLASPSSTTKAKWLYAFNLDPSAPAPASPPAGSTRCPFTTSGLGKHGLADQAASSYSRFGNGTQHHSREDHGGRARKRQRRGDHRQPPPTQAECFFCLSNPNLSTHLITSIGEDAYLTTARGPVPTGWAGAGIPALASIPAHILIIPLAHAPTVAGIPSSAGDGEEARHTYTEMVRYRGALNAMVAAPAAGGGALGSACWEISRAAGVHAHWQWMPAPRDLLDRGLVEAGFRVEAENAGLPPLEARDVGEGEGEGDWFRLWLWNPATGKEAAFFMPLQPDQRFDLQFGRRVMAKLLGTPERAHWRDCGQSEETEKAEAEAFKTVFKEWDFTA